MVSRRTAEARRDNEYLSELGTRISKINKKFGKKPKVGWNQRDHSCCGKCHRGSLMGAVRLSRVTLWLFELLKSFAVNLDAGGNKGTR